MESDGGAAKPQWGTRLGFLMAAIGSAVGLGNLWRFPFQAGENGGGAFVLVYILCVFLIGLPVLMAELAIGRHEGLSAVGSTRNLAIDAGRSPRWQIAGWLGLVAAIVVLPSYAMISGQIMAYSVMAFMGELNGSGPLSLYDGTTDSILWFTLFLVLTVAIVLRGLNKGIEAASLVLMPAFFLVLVSLALVALYKGAAKDAFAYLFAVRLDELSAQVVLAALGQALFSLGVGAGLMITYGSFLSKKEKIGANATVIAGSDTLVALVAGLMIFPIVFAIGTDPAAGMSLIFNTLPQFFAGIEFGHLIGGAFFFLAFIAALTSSISILMISRTIGIEQFGLSERKAALLFGLLGWAGGLGIALVEGFGAWMDWFVGSVVLPMGALAAALLTGWIVPRKVMRMELSQTGDAMFSWWRMMIRYPAPLAIGAIFLAGLLA